MVERIADQQCDHVPGREVEPLQLHETGFDALRQQPIGGDATREGDRRLALPHPGLKDGVLGQLHLLSLRCHRAQPSA